MENPEIQQVRDQFKAFGRSMRVSNDIYDTLKEESTKTDRSAPRFKEIGRLMRSENTAYDHLKTLADDTKILLDIINNIRPKDDAKPLNDHTKEAYIFFLEILDKTKFEDTSFDDKYKVILRNVETDIKNPGYESVQTLVPKFQAMRTKNYLGGKTQAPKTLIQALFGW